MNLIKCPKCNEQLYKHQNTYKCINKHSYDISKEGYINLLLANMHSNVSGDNNIMVQARTNFLNSEYYLQLSNKLNDLISDLTIDNANLLDLGCGEGYYTNNLYHYLTNINRVFKLYGLDISKDAIKKAAKTNKFISYIVASSANVPLCNNSYDLIYSIFSPCFDKEIINILKDNGILIIVSAGDKHLLGLKQVLYDNTYLNDEKEYFLPSFVLIDKHVIEYEIEVVKDDIGNLLKMTPYYYKTSTNDQMKLNSLTNLVTPIKFIISIYKKR